MIDGWPPALVLLEWRLLFLCVWVGTGLGLVKVQVQV